MTMFAIRPLSRFVKSSGFLWVRRSGRFGDPDNDANWKHGQPEFVTREEIVCTWTLLASVLVLKYQSVSSCTRIPRPKSSSVVCSLHSSTAHVRPKTAVATWLGQRLTAFVHLAQTSLSSSSTFSSSSCSVWIMQCCSAMRQIRTASSRSLKVCTLSTRWSYESPIDRPCTIRQCLQVKTAASANVTYIANSKIAFDGVGDGEKSQSRAVWSLACCDTDHYGAQLISTIYLSHHLSCRDD